MLRLVRGSVAEYVLPRSQGLLLLLTSSVHTPGGTRREGPYPTQSPGSGPFLRLSLGSTAAD